MFLKKSTSIDIASAMEKTIVASAHNDTNKVEIKRKEAADHLSNAAVAFEQAGKLKYAKAAIVIAKMVSEGKTCKKPSKMEKEVWAHFADVHYAEDVERYNQEEYQFYVIVNDNQKMKIESGWEYLDDAAEQLSNLPDDFASTARVYGERGLPRMNIDPNDDSSWIGEFNDGNQDSLEDKFMDTLLGEDESNSEDSDFEDVE